MSAAVHPIYINHDNIKFLLGTRDSILLVHEFFIYKRINGNFPKTTWKCTTKACDTTVITLAGKFQHSNTTPSHEHAQPIDDIALLETKMRIKKRVETEFNLSPRQIHA